MSSSPNLPWDVEPPPASAKEDSKDFLEHLRTVHFALLVASLAAVVIVLSPSRTDITRANEQLSQILTVQKAWKTSWLEAEALDKADSVCRMPPIRSSNLPLGRGGRPQDFPLGTVLFDPSESRAFHFDVKTLSMVLPQPTTLAAFRLIWDSNFELLCPAERLGEDLYEWNDETGHINPASVGRFIGDTGPTPPVLTSVQYNVLLHEVPVDKEHAEAQGLQFSKQVLTGFIIDYSVLAQTPHDHLAFPVMLRHMESFRIRPRILDEFSQYGWQPTDFHLAFPELDRVSTGFQDLGLEHLTNILAAQETSSKETFEAFGVKFPIEVATRWSVFLIVGIQLYFWLHLAEYRRRRYPPADVAWIGVYKRWFPRSVFVFTLIAPTAVVAFLCLKSELLESQLPNLILSVLAGVLSASLAGLNSHEFININRNLRIHDQWESAGPYK